MLKWDRGRLTKADGLGKATLRNVRKKRERAMWIWKEGVTVELFQSKTQKDLA